MIIVKTPLRISFCGGGTDFPDFFRIHGGAVVSSAIDKYIYTIIKERFDDKIYINYSKKEIVNHVGQIEHELVREAMRKTGVKTGIEISFLSDIPSEGSGLGSSSTVTVGILNALYHYIGHTPTAEQLAQEASEIEIDILKKPIGYQDQYIAAYGGLRAIYFQPNKIEIENIQLEEYIKEDFDNHLMLYFTGKQRKSAGILKEQKDNVSKKIEILKKMAQQAIELKNHFKNNNISKIGKLLDEAWFLKKQLASKISNSEFDRLYLKAKKAGAVGGKIAGAGGGGFFLLFVPSSKRQKVRAALKDLKEMPFRLERDGSKVIFNIRR